MQTLHEKRRPSARWRDTILAGWAMQKFHTHYDNLKVSRDAPPEVIRAAYKSLSQMYHPDRNHGDPSAARAMVLINAAYEVLSNPTQRRQHDEWILSAESPPAEAPPGPRRPAPYPKPSTPPSRPGFDISTHLKRYGIAYAAPVFMLVVLGFEVITGGISSPQRKVDSSDPRVVVDSAQPPSQQTTPGAVAAANPIATTTAQQELLFKRYAPLYVLPPLAPLGAPSLSPKGAPPPDNESAKPPTRTTPPVRQPYVRTIVAPSGAPWPSASGYVSGFDRLHEDGLSTVTVDNGQNGSDAFVKLVHHEGGELLPARCFFIRAHDRFTLEKVRAGRYDIRYRDLDSGTVSRSDTFDLLEEIQVAEGAEYTKYSRMKLTLYTVVAGNMRMQGISEEEFELRSLTQSAREPGR